MMKQDHSQLKSSLLDTPEPTSRLPAMADPGESAAPEDLQTEQTEKYQTSMISENESTLQIISTMKSIMAL